MLQARIDDTLTVYYENDDYTDPWTSPERILLIHGVAETSRAWFGSVARLARRFRLLRPDLRGLVDHVGLRSVHVVGQRVGGSAAIQFACDYPDSAKRLTVIGGPATLANSSLNPKGWLAQVEKEAVESWARTTMGGRLGQVSPAMRDWWIQEMGTAPAQVMVGIFRYVSRMNITHLLPPTPAPTLVIISDRGALAAVETVRESQTQIPNSQLLVLPSTAYHLAATMPDACADAVLLFIQGLKSEQNTERQSG